LLADFFKNPLTEVVGKGHGVRFVAHAHALQPILTGIFERVTDDALDAFAGIHVLLNGDFVRCAFLEEAPDSHIEAFGVLAEHLHGLRSNSRPDAVAGNYRDAGCRTAISQGNAGQGLASSTVRHPLARGYSSIKVHHAPPLPSSWGNRQFTRSVGGLWACPRGYNVICGRGEHARMQMNR